MLKRTVVLMIVLVLILSASVVFAGGKQETKEETATEEKTEEQTMVKDEVLDLVWDQQEKGVTTWPYTQGREFDRAIPFDTLTIMSLDFSEALPHVAESWKISDDKKVYTFTLRKDVLFHDGEKLMADDVAASFKALIGCTKTDSKKVAPVLPIMGAPNFRKGESDEISGIKIIDNYTIQFALENPSYDFMFGISGIHIFPEHLILKDTEPALFHQSEYWQSPIGSGPYKIAKRVPGDYDELVAFEDYFKGAPKIKKIVIRHRDPILAAEAGQMDRYQAKHPAQVKPLMDIEGLRGYKIDGLYKREIWTNLTKPYLQDERVRWALAHAIDRDAICEDLLEGLAKPWFSPMTPTYWANYDLEPIEYNPQKSRELLAQAGWDSSREIDFVYYYTDTQTQDLVVLLQSYFAEVGVKMKPRLLERDVAAILYEQKDFDLGYGANNGFDGNFLEKYMSGSAKAIGYSNSRVDSLLEQARNEMDRQKRKDLYDEVQEILYKELPEIPLFAIDMYIIESENLVKPKDDIYAYYPANTQIEKWYFK